MPQPATLTTMIARIAMPAHIAIRPMGMRPPPALLLPPPGPRKIGAVNAMLFSLVVDQPRRNRERPSADISAIGHISDMRRRECQRCSRPGCGSLEYR